MKKNAGISTIMVTGMAVFISVFAMVLLIVLRNTVGGQSDNSKALADAEARAKTVLAECEKDISNAEINVEWDAVKSALVCASKEQFVVTWLFNGNIYRVAIPYSEGKTTDEEKFEDAMAQARAFLDVKADQTDLYATVRATQQTLAINFATFDVNVVDAGAKVKVRTNYAEADKKGKSTNKIYENSVNVNHSAGTVAYRTAHPAEK